MNIRRLPTLGLWMSAKGNFAVFGFQRGLGINSPYECILSGAETADRGVNAQSH